MVGKKSLYQWLLLGILYVYLSNVGSKLEFKSSSIYVVSIPIQIHGIGVSRLIVIDNCISFNFERCDFL